MIKKRYERNRIYLSPKEQERISSFKVLLGGAGIGSNIAETLIRLGFEQLTIVDGDEVEESNLNRQDYTMADLGRNKAEALKDRLLQTNPEAKIVAIPHFITEENVEGIINGHDVAVNALDFRSMIPFTFDSLCSQKGIYVLHPYNIGFGSVVMVMRPRDEGLESLLKEGEGYQGFEKRAIQHVIDYFNYWARPKLWMEEIKHSYETENKNRGELLSPPQLAIASSIAAGMCASIIYRIATQQFIKVFPKFYYYSVIDDLN